MGCDNPKEKIEDEMMKIKMARIDLQMERHNQLELLKGIDGGEINIKTPSIPDYIDKEFLKNHFLKTTNYTSNLNEEEIIRQKTKRSKSVRIRRNDKKFTYLDDKERKAIFRKKTSKKLTLKV